MPGIRPRHAVDCNGRQAEEDFLGWDYRTRNAAGQAVAVVSEALFNPTDTCPTDVYDPQDALTRGCSCLPSTLKNARKMKEGALSGLYGGQIRT